MDFHFHIPPEERKFAPWVAGLAAWGFFAALFPIPTGLLWDEAVYLSTAENLGKSVPYYSEISYRPPLLPILLRIGGSVMRMDLFGHIIGALFFAAGVVVMYLLGRRLFGRIPGLITAALTATCPFALHFSHKIMTDVPSSVLATASMLCFFQMAGEEEEHEPSRALAIAAGVLLASAVLMRFILGALFVIPIYLFLLNRISFRPVAIAAAAATATIAPYLLWAQITQGGAWKPFTEAMFVVGGSEAVSDPLYYLTAIWMIGGPVLLIGITIYLAPKLGRRTGDTLGRDLPLLIWVAILFVYLTLSQHKESRYLLPAMPVLFLYAGAGFARCTRKMAIVAAVVVLCGVGYQLKNLAYFRGMQELGESQLLSYADHTRQAVEFLRPQIEPAEVVYTSSLYPIVAWYSKANTIALWPWTDEFYAAFPKNMKRDGYLVFYKGFGKEPNEEWLDHRLEFRKVKEFPDVTIYAYSTPVPLSSKPEAAESTDRVGTESPAGSGNR